MVVLSHLSFVISKAFRGIDIFLSYLPITLGNNKKLSQKLSTAMNNQQQDNKAMLNKGLVHAAITASTIANYLAEESRKASVRRNQTGKHRTRKVENN
ncbi:hypothetical protein NUACC21_18470 [Scytonema sp. NUACC21]